MHERTLSAGRRARVREKSRKHAKFFLAAGFGEGGVPIARVKWLAVRNGISIACSPRGFRRGNTMNRARMGEVVFMVEPDSRAGHLWHIRQSGSVRATYQTRAQAVVDARQLAAFENELRGRTAIVRVFDAAHRVVEDLVCAYSLRGPKTVRTATPPRAKSALR
jgi:hypothetical protein